MKKLFIITLAFVFLLMGCTSKSPIQTAINCTRDQANAIEKILSDNNIEVKSITEASIESDSEDNPFLTTLLAAYAPYEVESSDGKMYRITIKKDDKTLFSIVDSETNEFLYGGIGGLFDESLEDGEDITAE